MRTAAILISIALASLLAGCRPAAVSDGTPEPTGPEVNGIRVAWDRSSMFRFAEKGGYPRLKRLQDNSLLAIYETYTGHIDMRRSHDDGATWSDPQRIFPQFRRDVGAASTLVNNSNPEIVQLAGGELVVACNYRPVEAEIVPFSIVIRRSEDNGATWSEPQVVYDAEPRFGDGCWEPSFLQLPGGELHIYFADEGPYTHSDEQQISVISSGDEGVTWSGVRPVSFRAGKRDGMPVAALVGDEIVVTIEDNGVGQFKPFTVRSGATVPWASVVSAASSDREYALDEAVDQSVYMGAPYILALPSGETLISYQTNENRDANWELSTMEVVVGDGYARNFGKRTRPFDVPLTREAKWNSLALWDAGTVVALASTNFGGGDVAPWMIKGYIVPELVLGEGEVTDYPVFVGAVDETRLRAGVSRVADNLHVRCRVADDSVRVPAIGHADGVYIYLWDWVRPLRVWSDCEGRTEAFVRENGAWRPETVTGLVARATDSAQGYDLDITIPLLEAGMTGGRVDRLAVALSSSDGLGGGYVEMVSGARDDRPGSWLRVADGE